MKFDTTAIVWCIRTLIPAALLALFSAGPALAQCSARQGGSFRVFNALNYADQPELRARGLYRAHVIDRGFWRDEAKMDAVDPAKVRAVVDALPKDGGPIVIDIEHFHTQRTAPGAAKSVAMLADTAKIFRSAAGGREVGYYGLVPLGDYWRAIDVPAGGVRDWQQDSDFARPISDSVTVLFPSLYTFYEDRDGWLKRTRASICEARRIARGKPIYGFLWPEYHESNRKPGKSEWIPADYWRMQLETLHDYADGVVLFGGFALNPYKVRTWDERAPWWRETGRAMEGWRDLKRDRP